MKLVIFGLTMSSSWGNGHATLWRGLCKALNRLGHSVVFFEHNQPYYEVTRDWHSADLTELVIYEGWWAIRDRVVRHLLDADVAIVTSYCPDAIDACNEILESRALRVFYDLDTPVTLSNLHSGEPVPYLGSDSLRPYELVLSYTGGTALDELRGALGAREVAPLYGHVDPHLHRHVDSVERFRADLSYMGTYAADRQFALETLFVAPARKRPALRFVMGGAQYPDSFPWTDNVFFLRHLPPSEHAAFFSSSRLTLNVTRLAMARMGWCPSGRLFEAAACRTAILSDDWAGMPDFYAPGEEIIIARNTDEALAALDLSDAALATIAQRAYERTLEEHTSHRRAQQLIALLESFANRQSPGSSARSAHHEPPARREMNREADQRS
jgi:spore maturation protein CgeB